MFRLSFRFIPQFDPESTASRVCAKNNGTDLKFYGPLRGPRRSPEFAKRKWCLRAGDPIRVGLTFHFNVRF